MDDSSSFATSNRSLSTLDANGDVVLKLKPNILCWTTVRKVQRSAGNPLCHSINKQSDRGMSFRASVKYLERITSTTHWKCHTRLACWQNSECVWNGNSAFMAFQRFTQGLKTSSVVYWCTQEACNCVCVLGKHGIWDFMQIYSNIHVKFAETQWSRGMKGNR